MSYILERGFNSLIELYNLSPNLDKSVEVETERIKDKVIDLLANKGFLDANYGVITPAGNQHFATGEAYLDNRFPYYYYDSSQNRSIELILDEIYMISIYGKCVFTTGITFTGLSFNGKKNNNVILTRLGPLDESFYLSIHSSTEVELEIKFKLDSEIIAGILLFYKNVLLDFRQKDVYHLQPMGDKNNIFKIEATNFTIEEFNDYKREEISKFIEGLTNQLANLDYENKELVMSKFNIEKMLDFYVSMYLLTAFQLTTDLKYTYLLPSFFVTNENTQQTFGTLVLSIKNEIKTINHLNVIRLLNSEQWKLLNTLNLNRLSKDAEWKTIVDEMTHHNHHLYGALREGANKLEWQLKDKTKVLSHRVNILANSNDFLLALNKRSVDPAAELSETLEKTISMENFKPSTILIDVLNILEVTFSDLGFITTSVQNKSFITFKKLQKNIHKFGKDEPYINNNKHAIFICLFEFIKNAIRHSDVFSPSYMIKTEVDDDCYKFVISNNKLLKDNDILYIQSLGDKKASISKSGYGLNTIFRVIKSRINKQKFKIDFTISRNEWEKETEIILKVPINN